MLNEKIDIRITSLENAILLYFPLITLLLCLVEIIFFGSFYFINYKQQLKFIQTVLLLNGVHICFTFLLLLKTSAGKNSIHKIYKNLSHTFLYSNLFILFSSLLIFTFLFKYYAKENLAIELILILLLKLIPLHHTIKQNYGINLYLLNDKSNISKLKNAYNHNLIFSILTTISFSFYFKVLNSLWWITAFSFIGIFLFLKLIFADNQLSKIKSIDFTTLIYQLRVIPYILLPFSSFASFAISSNHGIEYTCIFFHFLRKEKKNILLYLALTFLLILIWPFLSHGEFIPKLSFNHLELSRNLRLNLLITVYAFTFLHYNLDHYLYSSKYSADN